MVRGAKLVTVLLVLLLLSGAVLAQDATATPNEPARARLAQFAIDAPELEIYIDDQLYTAPDGSTAVPPGGVSTFEAFVPGTYTVALSPVGSGVEAAVVGPEALTLEAGHAYTVAVVGQYADDNLRFLLIDETAAFPDVASISSRILVNNLKGAPNLDMLVNGETIISDLTYGEAATAEQPIGIADSILFTAAGEPENVIFTGTMPHFRGGVTYLLALAGSYPGEVFTDFFPVPAVVYMGEISTSDGGAIAPGDEVTGELAAPGERAAYTLDLAQDATVNIALAGQVDSPLDAYVRLYDADGNLLAENDELDFEDDVADAGLVAQELPAGTYTLEVASWGDAFPGPYTLSVETAE